MYAAQSPCAIWRKQTLRVQSIACTNAAPFYRGERRQTHPVTNPALAASPTLLRIKASETQSYKPQSRDNIMTHRVNLSRQTCRYPSASAGTTAQFAARTTQFASTRYGHSAQRHAAPGDHAWLTVLPRLPWACPPRTLGAEIE